MKALSEKLLAPVDASDVPFYRIDVVADVAFKTFLKFSVDRSASLVILIKP